jgi:hypothetical protein
MGMNLKAARDNCPQFRAAVVRACDQLKLSEEYVAGCLSSAMG